MRFNELNSIRLNKLSDTLIYFLLNKEGDVVYVGKTTSGVFRPLMHKNKNYEFIEIIQCEACELDSLENYYILKYTPKYNKQPNYNKSISLNKAKILIRNKYNLPTFNKHKLKSIINILNIKIYMVDTNTYILKDDLQKIITYLQGGYNQCP